MDPSSVSPLPVPASSSSSSSASDVPAPDSACPPLNAPVKEAEEKKLSLDEQRQKERKEARERDSAHLAALLQKVPFQSRQPVNYLSADEAVRRSFVDQHSKVKTAVEDLRAQIASQRDAIGQKDLRIAALTRDNATLTESVKHKDEKIEDLTAHNRELNDASDRLHKANEARDAEIAQLHEQLTVARARAVEFQQQLEVAFADLKLNQ